jgi:hypothetical protein
MSNYEVPEAPLKDKGQAKEIYKDSKVRIIVPFDQQAACYYGQGTRWCTAATKGANYFDNYNSRGKLYILLPQQPQYEGEKYQLHFSDDQYMDEEDDPVRIEFVLRERFPELLPFFTKLEPKLLHYVVFADEKLLRKIGDQIEEYAMNHVAEVIDDWRTDDPYFRDWQFDSAVEQGLIDPETMTDEDMWDIIHDNDELNDYYRYNSEAEVFTNLMRQAVVMSVSEMREYASDMSSYEYDGDGSPVDYQELDEVYKFGAENYLNSKRNRDRYDIGEWIQAHISIDSMGNVSYVGRY